MSSAERAIRRIKVNVERMKLINKIMRTMTVTNENGKEEPYFSNEFMLMKLAKMNKADLELNRRIKIKNND